MPSGLLKVHKCISGRTETPYLSLNEIPSFIALLVTSSAIYNLQIMDQDAALKKQPLSSNKGKRGKNVGQPGIQALLFAGAHSGTCFCMVTVSNVWYSEKAVELGLCSIL